jgi:hypothetical protein
MRYTEKGLANEQEFLVHLELTDGVRDAVKHASRKRLPRGYKPEKWSGAELTEQVWNAIVRNLDGDRVVFEYRGDVVEGELTKLRYNHECLDLGVYDRSACSTKWYSVYGIKNMRAADGEEPVRDLPLPELVTHCVDHYAGDDW